MVMVSDDNDIITIIMGINLTEHVWWYNKEQKKKKNIRKKTAKSKKTCLSLKNICVCNKKN